MPEIPDFQRIARHVFMTEDYHGNPIPEIEEALRLVWNARGAADIATLDTELAAIVGGKPYLKHLETVLRKLDR